MGYRCSGRVAALALWLYLIHVLVLVGYRLTLVLDGWGRVQDGSSAT